VTGVVTRVATVTATLMVVLGAVLTVSPVPTSYVNTECQICRIHSHPTSDCWWCY
jgi:hypothetical protein